MFVLAIFATLLCYATAGLIPLDEGYGYGGLALAPKVAYAAPTIAVKAGATSYQNSNLLALHPTPVVTKIAAPIGPIITKVAAPISYAAPALNVVSVGHGYGLDHGYGLGLGGYGLGYGKY